MEPHGSNPVWSFPYAGKDHTERQIRTFRLDKPEKPKPKRKRDRRERPPRLYRYTNTPVDEVKAYAMRHAPQNPGETTKEWKQRITYKTIGAHFGVSAPAAYYAVQRRAADIRRSREAAERERTTGKKHEAPMERTRTRIAL
jgi:hypothetical protein